MADRALIEDSKFSGSPNHAEIVKSWDSTQPISGPGLYSSSSEFMALAEQAKSDTVSMKIFEKIKRSFPDVRDKAKVSISYVIEPIKVVEDSSSTTSPILSYTGKDLILMAQSNPLYKTILLSALTLDSSLLDTDFVDLDLSVTLID